MRHRLLGATCVLFAWLWTAAPVVAQSTTTGEVAGVVTSAGASVEGALVSLTALGGGSSQETTTNDSGAFVFAFVVPGSYELRVEAIGYRPLVARVLTLGGGDRRSVALSINAAPPPVVSVDTVALAGGSSTHLRAGGTRMGPNELEQLPHRFNDLASVVALSPMFDESLGAQGLPGSMTLVIADGIPFYRAPHPTANSELVPDALFPTSSLSGVTALHNAPDIEWAGAAGGYVAVGTGSTRQGRGIEAEAAYSGSPTWQSSELDFMKPSLVSFEGGLRGTVVPSSGTSQLVLSADALRHQTPLGPRLSETAAMALAGFDPDLLASLTDPAVESYARYSGLARLDVDRGSSGRIFLRGAGSFTMREFEGAGPISLARNTAPAEESVDFSVAGGIVSERSSTVTLELRGGVSGSYRDFGPSVADTPPAYLVDTGVSLGDLPSARGESSRTDVILTPVLRYAPGFGAFKLGATVRGSSHSMAHSRAELGDLFYSDATALRTSRGFGLSSKAPESSFSTREIGGFAQYDAILSPGLRVSFGGRYDYERFNTGDIQLRAQWLAASGIDNTEFTDAFHQFGARGSIEWDPSATGGTRVLLAGSLHEGDIDTRAIYQMLPEDRAAATTRLAGPGIDWPSGGVPAGSAPELPTITLLGPDTRAPRTANFSAAIVQRLTEALSAHVGGSMRRTDFLMRRRNLNLPTLAQAVDPYGRDVLGTPRQDGSMVTATDDDARRFISFGDVWALDPDGWSEYRGIAGGLEYSSPTVDVYGAYTYSETTDNWVGAASGLVDAMLSPGLPDAAQGDGDWSEGTSDFDVPNRIAAGATVRFGRAAVSASYHFRSGLPFTPSYRPGIDANADGSLRNDVAFVPGDSQLTALLDAWPCLEMQADAFATRNSCRGPVQHGVNARIRVELGVLGGREARLVIDGLNLVEGTDGVLDNALLVVDPAGTITTSPDGATLTIPVTVNPGFGTVLYPSTRGRMVRIGLRIGG